MKKKVLIGLVILSMGVLYLKILSPMFHIHIPCVFRQITGYNCPGCGMTRAAVAFLNGELYQAFRYNMLVFILAPLYLLYLLLEKANKLRASKYLMGGMLALTGLFFVLRNTEMFAFLAPTQL